MTRVSGGALAALGAAALAVAALGTVIAHTHHKPKPKTAAVSPAARSAKGSRSASPKLQPSDPPSNGQPTTQPSLADVARRSGQR